MTAQVTIVLADAKNSLVVPVSALARSPDGQSYTVTVYDPKAQTTRQKAVTVGINNDVTAEIQDGLAEGDLVVTTGGASIGNGVGEVARSGTTQIPGRRGFRAPLGL